MRPDRVSSPLGEGRPSSCSGSPTTLGLPFLSYRRPHVILIPSGLVCLLYIMRSTQLFTGCRSRSRIGFQRSYWGPLLFGISLVDQWERLRLMHVVYLCQIWCHMGCISWCQILGVLRGPKTLVSHRRYHGVHQLAIDAQQADSILFRSYSDEGMYIMISP
jgi:hypothetical protein